MIIGLIYYADQVINDDRMRQEINGIFKGKDQQDILTISFNASNWQSKSSTIRLEKGRKVNLILQELYPIEIDKVISKLEQQAIIIKNITLAGCQLNASICQKINANRNVEHVTLEKCRGLTRDQIRPLLYNKKVAFLDKKEDSLDDILSAAFGNLDVNQILRNMNQAEATGGLGRPGEPGAMDFNSLVKKAKARVELIRKVNPNFAKVLDAVVDKSSMNQGEVEKKKLHTVSNLILFKEVKGFNQENPAERKKLNALRRDCIDVLNFFIQGRDDIKKFILRKLNTVFISGRFLKSFGFHGQPGTGKSTINQAIGACMRLLDIYSSNEEDSMTKEKRVQSAIDLSRYYYFEIKGSQMLEPNKLAGFASTWSGSDCGVFTEAFATNTLLPNGKVVPFKAAIVDEVDKMKPVQGSVSPSIILNYFLPVLDDRETARKFNDAFFNIDFPVCFSGVIFNGNEIPTHADAFKDRIQWVKVTGYSDKEKRDILYGSVLHKLVVHHLPNLKKTDYSIEGGKLEIKSILNIDSGVFDFIIRAFSHTAGIREIAETCNDLIEKTYEEYIKSGYGKVIKVTEQNKHLFLPKLEDKSYLFKYDIGCLPFIMVAGEDKKTEAVRIMTGAVHGDNGSTFDPILISKEEKGANSIYDIKTNFSSMVMAIMQNALPTSKYGKLILDGKRFIFQIHGLDSVPTSDFYTLVTHATLAVISKVQNKVPKKVVVLCAFDITGGLKETENAIDKLKIAISVNPQLEAIILPKSSEAEKETYIEAMEGKDVPLIFADNVEQVVTYVFEGKKTPARPKMPPRAFDRDHIQLEPELRQEVEVAA